MLKQSSPFVNTIFYLLQDDTYQAATVLNMVNHLQRGIWFIPKPGFAACLVEQAANGEPPEQQRAVDESNLDGFDTNGSILAPISLLQQRWATYGPNLSLQNIIGPQGSFEHTW